MVMPAVIPEGMREGMSEVLTESMSEGMDVSQHREVSAVLSKGRRRGGVGGVVGGVLKGTSARVSELEFRGACRGDVRQYPRFSVAEVGMYIACPFLLQSSRADTIDRESVSNEPTMRA